MTIKLDRPICDDPEVIIEGKLEYLRLYLAHHMRTLREEAALTQGELAERLGKKQAAVSKLENSLVSHDIESVMRYLHALEAELLVAIKAGDRVLQVSDNEEVLLVDVPAEVEEWADQAKISPRSFVRAAVEKQRGFSQYAILPMNVNVEQAPFRKVG